MSVATAHDSCIPFVEKYRPKNFADIVLSPLNKRLLSNIISSGYFPHLLFYGPPGVGKTTSIMNLIQAYQLSPSGGEVANKSLIMHLNASDERGIDVIRNLIHTYVMSKPMFCSKNAVKFVILDEADYMTIQAQQSLHNLINLCTCAHSPAHTQVRFCIICNYISKIIPELQNNFVNIRFNNLPKTDMLTLLSGVCTEENITMSPEQLENIRVFYKSDVRSMLNFIQTSASSAAASATTPTTATHILSFAELEVIYNRILGYRLGEKRKPQPLSDKFLCSATEDLCDMCDKYNMNMFDLLKCLCNHIIKNKQLPHLSEFLTFVKEFVHSSADINDPLFIKHIVATIRKLCSGSGSVSLSHSHYKHTSNNKCHINK